MDGLKIYFNAIANEIHAQAERSKVFTNPSDTGHNREKILLDFLCKHLPKRLHPVLGGKIFGSNSTSNQIDIIISNDISVNYEYNEKTFVAVENVASAISVKSNLDKSSLYESLKNISSIPQINKNILKFNSNIFKPEDHTRFLRAYPVSFIFAYDGISKDTCLEHINDFYNKEENKSINVNRYPRAIIVNKKYFIKCPTHDINLADGKKAQKDRFYGLSLNSEIIGLPFSNMLNDINQYISYLPMVVMEYFYYSNKSFFNIPIE